MTSIVKPIEAELKALLAKTPGLQAVTVSDRDGITLARAEAKQSPRLDTKMLSSVFSSASEQASKLSLGTNTTITTFYEGCTVVFANYSPLVVSFVGGESLNVGLIVKTIVPELGEKLKDVRTKVDSVVDPSAS